MAKFKKLPVEVEAWQIGSTEPQPDWLAEAIDAGQVQDGKAGEAMIGTREGTMIGNVGDWIIQGVAGELYPCKPEIFDVTYEAVED